MCEMEHLSSNAATWPLITQFNSILLLFNMQRPNTFPSTVVPSANPYITTVSCRRTKANREEASHLTHTFGVLHLVIE